MGQPNLAQTLNYLKLFYQRLIEPIRILRNVDTKIMGIATSFNFEVIELVEGTPTYTNLFGPQMKPTISLERDRIKLKESGRKIIIPLDPKEGKPWMESWDEDQEAICLYEINNEQKNYIKLTAEG